jgi:transcriptional regulator with XRE-family HTH domain
MIPLREIFAKNLKANRKNCGLTQAKLAELADISTHYIAMMELAHNFPTAEIIERIAAALDIEIYELFAISRSPKEELDKFRQLLIIDMRQMVEDAVETAFSKRDMKPRK